jgi:hypothetical protein
MGFRIGQLAWVLLGLVGLFTVVDLGFGPMVICPQCGHGLNLTFGVIMILVAAAALIINRAAPVATR